MATKSRGVLSLVVLAGLAGCAAPGARSPNEVGSLPAEAHLDARGLGRGVAAARPTSVQVQDNPGSPVILYTVSPRLQTGSVGSLPMVVTSVGAERQRADGTLAFRALVVVSNARGHRDFSRASTRQNDVLAVAASGRQTRCVGAGGCLYEETVMLSLPAELVRRSVDSGSPLRVRLSGGAAFVELAIPPGHLRAVLEATAGTAPR